MRLAMLQLAPLVGDVRGNAQLVADGYREAVAAGAGLVQATELALSGYPPEDLVYKPAFVAAVEAALGRLAQDVGDVPLVVGFVEDVGGTEPTTWRPVASDASPAPKLGNSAAVLRNGQVAGVYRKQRLPNYGVFDEARYFVSGHVPLVFDVGGVTVGVTICEDLWGPGGPLEASAAAGARLILNLNASPFRRGVARERERWAAHHTTATGAWLAYCNQACGQDELVFDGDSFVMAPDGTVVGRGAEFGRDLVVVDLPLGSDASGPRQLAGDASERLPEAGEIYGALVTGTRDYVLRNGFHGALIGLSGGIDSALVAAIAADALGPSAVQGVAMPSPHSSDHSLADAQQLAKALGIGYQVIPIGDVMAAYDRALSDAFEGTAPGVAEENIQSRIRGNLLMALSNKHGDIVLATGNKSEYAVGYATLYGDMAGGFAVIKDVPKTLVYELARWRNAATGLPYAVDTAVLGPVIPASTLTKPPSAELRPGQEDTDTLPPYDVLDPILEAYVEQDDSVEEIAGAGYDLETVRAVTRLVDRAEYKRRQSAPGVKITLRAFGKDRRLPITQAWTAQVH